MDGAGLEDCHNATGQAQTKLDNFKQTSANPLISSCCLDANRRPRRYELRFTNLI